MNFTHCQYSSIKKGRPLRRFIDTSISCLGAHCIWEKSGEFFRIEGMYLKYLESVVSLGVSLEPGLVMLSVVGWSLFSRISIFIVLSHLKVGLITAKNPDSEMLDGLFSGSTLIISNTAKNYLGNGDWF